MQPIIVFSSHLLFYPSLPIEYQISFPCSSIEAHALIPIRDGIATQARPALGRPVYVVEPALNVAHLDGAKIPTVSALAAVVTQTETVPVGHDHFGHVAGFRRIHYDRVDGGSVFLSQDCPGLPGLEI